MKRLNIDAFVGYGCGPLSLAVLARDADGIREILRKCPTAISEVNSFSQTPFHLAAGCPSVMKVLVGHDDLSTIDRLDCHGYHAVSYAVALSSRHCTLGTSPTACTNCDCTSALDLLLEQGPSFETWPQRPGSPRFPVRRALLSQFLAPELLSGSSQSARLRLLEELKRRRVALARLARSYLSSFDCKQLGLDRPQVLDSRVLEVITLLNQKGIEVPRMLRPRLRKDIYCGSVFHLLGFPGGHLPDWNTLSEWTADVAYQLGFRDVDGLDTNGMTPLQSSTSQPFIRQSVDPAYCLWLGSRGADPFNPYGPVPRWGYPGHTPAHMLTFFCGGQHRWLTCSSRLVREIVTLVAGRRVPDGCNCGCTVEGCETTTLFTHQLQDNLLARFVPCPRPGVNLRGPGDKSDPAGVAQRILAQLHDISLNITQWRHVCLATIRLLTFDCLGLTHTCCSGRFSAKLRYDVSRPSDSEYWASIYKPLDPDEVTEIHEEDQAGLTLLEELVDEFERLCDGLGTFQFGSFLTSHWAPRMEEALAKLNEVKMTAEELKRTQDIGVVWDVSSEGSSEPKTTARSNEYLLPSNTG